MGKEFEISGENGGLHILIKSRRRIPEKDLLQAAAQAGLKLYGISDACMGQGNAENTAFAGTVLLGYGALDKQELFQGTELLKEAWSAYL